MFVEIHADTFRVILPLALVIAGQAIQIRNNTAGTILRVIGFLSFLLNIPLPEIFSSILVVSAVVMGALIAAYTTNYSRVKYGGISLVVLIDFFTISMIFVFSSRYLIELITFWLLTELLGFFLIAYDYIFKGDRLALVAATRYLLLSMIPTDIALFILLALTGFEPSFTIPLKQLQLQLLNPVVLAMIIFGFFSKAAIFPFHFWLPDAHSIAPAPASALLSGIMVKMGIYALYLLTSYNIDKGSAIAIMLIPGTLTVIYGALQACLQYDIKRLLAYSTTSNTALIAITIALYLFSADKLFLEAAVLYTIAHAFYKAFMFLDSGFIEALVHERDIRRLGYISKISPLETVALFIAILSIFGMPPSSGFLAKIFLFTAIAKYLSDSWLYILILFLAALKVSLAVAYNAIYLRTHIGSEATAEQIHNIDKEALSLRRYTFATSLATFVPIIFLSIAVQEEYIELKLLRKIMPQLAVSAFLFIIACMFIYSIKRERHEG